MKLATLFQHLHSQAQRSGRDQATTLAGGARIAVRCIEGETTLTIARSPQRVGDRELITFRNQCGVPTTALRWPAEDQRQVERDGKHWWCVAFRWVVAPPVVWVCLLCEEERVFDAAADYIAHAQEAHDIDPIFTRAAQGETTGHIDTRDWYQTTTRYALADGRAICVKHQVARR